MKILTKFITILSISFLASCTSPLKNYSILSPTLKSAESAENLVVQDFTIEGASQGVTLNLPMVILSFPTEKDAVRDAVANTKNKCVVGVADAKFESVGRFYLIVSTTSFVVKGKPIIDTSIQGCSK